MSRERYEGMSGRGFIHFTPPAGICQQDTQEGRAEGQAEKEKKSAAMLAMAADASDVGKSFLSG